MGWSELLLIGIVALIVVGPKDLPVMFQSLGRMTAKVKRMARDFQRAMEDAADSTGVKDVAKDLNSSMSPRSMGIDKLRDAADRFDKWDPTKAEDRKKKGPETEKLSEEREEAKRKITEATSKAATERKAKEAAAAAEAAELSDEPEVDETLPESGEDPVNDAAAAADEAPKPAPKKPAARKPAAKKPAEKTAAAAKKTAAKTPSTAKKPSAKANTAEKAPAKTRKAPARKTATKSKTKPAASGDAGVS